MNLLFLKKDVIRAIFKNTSKHKCFLNAPNIQNHLSFVCAGSYDYRLFDKRAKNYFLFLYK